MLADMGIFLLSEDFSLRFLLRTAHFSGSIKCYKQASYLAELLSTARAGVSEVNRRYTDMHGGLQSTICSIIDKRVQLLGIAFIKFILVHKNNTVLMHGRHIYFLV